MGKIIIDNRSDMTDLDAVDVVKNIVIAGRISNFRTQYCYLTVIGNYKGTGKNYQVASFLNKKSDRFVIIDTHEN